MRGNALLSIKEPASPAWRRGAVPAKHVSWTTVIQQRAQSSSFGRSSFGRRASGGLLLITLFEETTWAGLLSRDAEQAAAGTDSLRAGVGVHLGDGGRGD